jgi:hypothetical protein
MLGRTLGRVGQCGEKRRFGCFSPRPLDVSLPTVFRSLGSGARGRTVAQLRGEYDERARVGLARERRCSERSLVEYMAQNGNAAQESVYKGYTSHMVISG